MRRVAKRPPAVFVESCESSRVIISRSLSDARPGAPSLSCDAIGARQPARLALTGNFLPIPNYFPNWRDEPTYAPGVMSRTLLKCLPLVWSNETKPSMSLAIYQHRQKTQFTPSVTYPRRASWRNGGLSKNPEHVHSESSHRCCVETGTGGTPGARAVHPAEYKNQKPVQKRPKRARPDARKSGRLHSKRGVVQKNAFSQKSKTRCRKVTTGN